MTPRLTHQQNTLRLSCYTDEWQEYQRPSIHLQSMAQTTLNMPMKCELFSKTCTQSLYENDAQYQPERNVGRIMIYVAKKIRQRQDLNLQPFVR